MQKKETQLILQELISKQYARIETESPRLVKEELSRCKYDAKMKGSFQFTCQSAGVNPRTGATIYHLDVDYMPDIEPPKKRKAATQQN